MSRSYKLGDNVELSISGEPGIVIGRAEYLHSTPQCYVHYKQADGCATSDWFYEEQLSPGVANDEIAPPSPKY